jgi:hypothetical protein
MVERLAVNEAVAGSTPAWAASTEGRANWHDGTRLETGRGEQPLQVRVLSLPLSDKGVLLGEQPASKAGAEGSTPSALATVPDAPVAERSRHHPAKVDRWVRLPPGALFCPVMKLACQPLCRGGETGSIPVQGALRAEAERRGNRLIRGGRQVRLLPARLTGEWTGGGSSGVS